MTLSIPSLVVIGLVAFALACDAAGDLVLIWWQRRRRVKGGAR